MKNNQQISVKTVMSILSSALVAFVGILMTTSVNVNFPQLAKSFGEPLNAVQWFSTGCMVTSACTMMCSAYLDRRLSARTNFLMAVGAILLSLLICAWASSFSLFLLGRLLDGFCIGIDIPLMFNIITNTIPQKRLGFFMSLGATVITVGPTLGPTYGGLVSYYLGIRPIFLMVIPLIVIIAGLGIWSVSNHKRPASHLSFDLSGLTLILIALITLIIGFNSLSQFSISTLILLVIGIVSLGLFIKHGTRVTKPILNTRVFKNHHFTGIAIVYLMLQMTNMGLAGFLIPNFSQTALGTTSIVAGLIVLPGSLFRIVGMPVAGKVFDRYGAKLPINAGLITIAIFFTFMTFETAKLSSMMILLAYVVYSLGLALSFSTVLTAGLNTLPEQLKSDGNAVMSAVQIYGGALGISTMSLVIAITKHFNSNPTLNMRLGGQICFGVQLIITISGIIIMALSLKSKKLKH